MKKNPTTGFLLCLFFGPLGFFYTGFSAGCAGYIAGGLVSGFVASALRNQMIFSGYSSPGYSRYASSSTSPIFLLVVLLGLNVTYGLINYHLCQSYNAELNNKTETTQSAVRAKTIWELHRDKKIAIPQETSRQRFGVLPSGEEAELFTLQNDLGICAKITNYGCRIVSLEMPDRVGYIRSVLPGSAKFEDYVEQRIPCCFPLLGGMADFDARNKLWKPTLTANSLRLACAGSDANFGDYSLAASFTINQDEIIIDYAAACAKRAALAHPFLFSIDYAFGIEDYTTIAVNADSYMLLDKGNKPCTNVLQTKDTDFDLRQLRFVKQLSYNENGETPLYFLHDSSTWAAIVTDNNTGRIVEMTTTFPAIEVAPTATLQDKAYNPFAGNATYRNGVLIRPVDKNMEQSVSQSESVDDYVTHTVKLKLDIDWVKKDPPPEKPIIPAHRQSI